MSPLTRVTRGGLIALTAISATLAMSAAASASPASGTPGPAWAIESVALPSSFASANDEHCENYSTQCDKYAITATNVGTRSSRGTIVIKDRLPAGMEIVGAKGLVPGPFGSEGPGMSCSHTENMSSENTVECETEEVIPPGGFVTVRIRVLVTETAEVSVLNKAEVQEGTGPVVATREPTTVPNELNAPNAPFGFEAFGISAYNLDGEPDTQAGDHPGSLKATIDYTTQLAPETSELETVAVQEPKTELLDLPLGFVGDPLAAGQCPESDFYGEAESCPKYSQVGVVAVDYNGSNVPHLYKVYNVAPEPGYPAVFGFHVDEIEVLMRARVVPSAGGYDLSIAVPDVPRSNYLKVSGISLTLFGDPIEQDEGQGAAGATTFLTNPTNCSTGPLSASIEMNSWVDPADWVKDEASMYEASPTQGLTGCDLLQFSPTLTAAPDETTQADTPSGYEVDLKAPQTPQLQGGLATPDLRDAEIAFPEGVVASPSAANGLLGCQETGPEGINITHGWTPTGSEPLDPADPEAMTIAADGLPHVAPGHCPAASQIGTAEVTTPVLPGPLTGHVFLAEPKCGGAGQGACTEAAAANGELLGLYLEIEGSGVIVKLAGSVSANPATGQLTARFLENPQFPFSELKLRLNGQSRAPLANPQQCGTATTTSSLTSWSAEQSGAAATPFSQFPVTGCAGSMPFAPGVLAQSQSTVAGAYTPFAFTLSRKDGEQDFAGVSVTMPAGLLGTLAGVQQCPEAQAAAGTCGAGSLIGHTEVAAGSGSTPFWTAPGNVYLTGPIPPEGPNHPGAPFGLSIVVPTVAGPFRLAANTGQGDEVIRAAINVNPTTAAITITSGVGGDPLPQIIDGIPLRIQTIDVTVDGVGGNNKFTFNPTSCAQQSVSTTIDAAQGASAGVSSPFAATGCKGLPFKPTFTATTAGHASKAEGASLIVKIASKGGPAVSGEEANIRSVKVDLPVKLPSRLSTLQRACTSKQFEANPAGCPEEADVGTATATTPVLANPLKGPAYLVSHGGEAFPALEIVLQGEGITLVLDGNTLIKKGVTSSTFKTVPDAPISSFELKLPTKKFSILGTNLPESAHYNLCGQTLNMPTAITGQNGAEIHESTKIGVSGCAKHRKTSKKKPKKQKKGSKRKRQ